MSSIPREALKTNASKPGVIGVPSSTLNALARAITSCGSEMSAAEVMNKITPADISDPQEVIARATALSVEHGTPITPGFEALVFKASRGIEDIYELTYIRKDGSRFPAVVSVTALRDAQDAIIGYLLIGTDNTARKQIEDERMKLDQRLRDQHFYNRSLLESNIDALMTTDPRGIITDLNKQMEALTGCTRDELIGAPFKNGAPISSSRVQPVRASICLLRSVMMPRGSVVISASMFDSSSERL